MIHDPMPFGENGFLWSDYQFGWVSVEAAYVGRYINIILAICLAGLCVSALRFAFDRYQKARFIGLALFCVAMSYGTMSRMGGPATPRLPLYTAALLVSLYGLRGWLRSQIRDHEDS